jgi:sirohydrochlorin cobaltochelatase
MKKGLLMAAAGTSSTEASEAFCRIDGRIANRFGDLPRAWAYTSSGVRRKLAERGQHVDDAAEALGRLRQMGVTHLAVKPLHMAPGMEYSELCESAEHMTAGPNAFDRVVIDKPLMQDDAALARTVDALLAEIPADSSREEAVLFVAHGSRRAETREVYARAAALCRRLDRPVFLGTMTPQSSLTETVRECAEAGAKTIRLVPFMIAAGYSAATEIAGPGADSWQAAIEAAGMRCLPVMRGLGDHDGVIDVWLDQVGALLARLEEN